MTLKQLPGILAPDSGTYVTLTDGSGNLVSFSGSGGTVSVVSFVNANGVSGAIATPSTTPAITLSLAAITPTSVSTVGNVTAATGNFANITSTAVIIAATHTVSAGGPTVTSGTGAPTTSAAQGSIFLRSDGGALTSRMYVNTSGVSTWTAVSTLA